MSAFNLKVKVRGADALKKTFKDAGHEANKELKHMIRGQVNKIRDLLRQRAPKDTGELEKAIIARMSSRGGEPMGLVIITRGKNAKHDAYYWYFLEFGTENMDAKPFITPVVNGATSRALNEYRDQFFKKYAGAIERRAKANNVEKGK